MSGAEEAPPTSNATPPAVVPSPDDSAKEVTRQEVGTGEEALDDHDESRFIDVEGDSVGEEEERRVERLGSMTIDPSYNPSGEELLYEGDMEVEQPLPKSLPSDKETASQDEGFMISVHETGMELELSDSKIGTKSESEGGSGGKSTPHWRAGEGGVAGSKATPSGKTVPDSKGSASPRTRKDSDRFVL